MAANVETMMYVRETPWHGLGTRVEEAPNSEEALKLAGLDWEVNQQEVMTNGIIIPNYKANVRSSDGKVLGIVTDKYKIVNNKDAFSFTDNLIGGDVKYETAGSLYGGKKVWMLAKLPETKVVGDETIPYVCFTNNHDGTGAVKAIMTPIRVVCNNTLNLALSQAKRQWSMIHTGNLESKLEDARITLEFAEKYMYELDKKGNELANITINEEKFNEILEALFPINEEKDTERKINNVKELRNEFQIAYFMPDISKFRNTGWGMINAMSDIITHNKPKRSSATFQENNFGRIIDGHYMMDMLYKMLQNV